MMSHPSKNLVTKETESGVALLLSVLVLSAITAIAFSLATIVFIELRASRDVVRSEPALYATLGVTEEALFQYKRFVPSNLLDVTACAPAASNVCSMNGVNMNNPGPELLAEDDTPRLETVYAGETKTLPMFNLVSPGCDITCSWTPPFGEVELELVPLGSNGTLTASAHWIAQDGSEGTETAASLTESSGRQSYSNFFPNRQYELRLTNPSSTNMQVAIWTYGTNGSAKGLPFIARRVLKIVADYSGLTRTYRVEIPVGQSTLSSASSNVAAASAGATASASTTHASGNFPVGSAINGDRAGNGWGGGTGGWNDDGSGSYPDWFQVNFSGQKTISEVDVFTVQDAYWAPSEPTPSMTFTTYGLFDFQIQYDSDSGAGTTWTTVPGGTITGNNLVWRKVTFSDITTDKIRIYITLAGTGSSRITEVEAWGR